MSVSYELFTDAFLSKINEYDFLELDEEDREATINGYLRRAVTAFRKNCKYDLYSHGDDENKEFTIDIADEDIDEIVEIVSEGMVLQFMKPYLYKQELLEMSLNTRDFTSYSPAELLRRVGEAYERVKHDYTQMIREYSYNHSDLTVLHL